MMHVGPEKGAVLRRALRKTINEADGSRPVRVAEFGCYCGYAAVLMAATLSKHDQNDTSGPSSSSNHKVLTLDASEEACAWARRLVAHAGLTDLVEVVHADASDLPRLVKARGWTEGLDLLFIDHDKPRYLGDLRQAEKALRPGARVVADNILSFDSGMGMRGYLRYVRVEGPFSKSKFYPAIVEYSNGLFGTEDGVEVSVFLDADDPDRKRRSTTTPAVSSGGVSDGPSRRPPPGDGGAGGAEELPAEILRTNTSSEDTTAGGADEAEEPPPPRAP
mmetsp:Transcript_22216/g.88152  ORF Transcript_22216/g.88152 Transcript_22216/m.88152 type:complete len:277 (-) Transcript_22216:78-908(-)